MAQSMGGVSAPAMINPNGGGFGGMASAMGATSQSRQMETMRTPDGMTYQVPTQHQGSNPWGDMYGSDMGEYQNAAKQAPGRISALQGLQSNYSGGDGGYPAMPNAYNLGQNAGPSPGTASNPGYMTQEINKVMPESSSRGFNPWSLQGESNARGK